MGDWRGGFAGGGRREMAGPARVSFLLGVRMDPPPPLAGLQQQPLLGRLRVPVLLPGRRTGKRVPRDACGAEVIRRFLLELACGLIIGAIAIAVWWAILRPAR